MLSVSATTSSSSSLTASQTQLSASARQLLTRLQAADQSVRAHEQAHLAAAGGLQVSGPSYDYVTGPDGGRYAVGGEVQIQIPAGRTPSETIALNEQVQRAALAPANPSGQDRAVAASAAQRIVQAQGELQKQKADARSGAPADLWQQALQAYQQAQNPFADPGLMLSAMA